MTTTPYRVGVTAEGVEPDGTTLFGDIGLERLAAAGLSWEVMPPAAGHAPAPEDLEPYDAVLSIGHLQFTREVVAAAPRLRHVARFGAGYDGIDLEALADAGVVVTNTPEAVRRPLAASAVTLLLALAHRLLENHAAATSGRWSERGRYRGPGIAGRTVGIIGLGSVGADVARLLAPFGARVVTQDRPSARDRAAELGIDCLPLEDLVAQSDYVVLTAALTPTSRHMVDAAFLAAMKPTASLVNVARGGLVDQPALTAALAEGGITGAGLDVLDPAPPLPGDPLLRL
ncbi:2-hydroxyacid dehydrogenase, partial [Actinotalea sp. C106]|uniref:2-hydroxyacid dehydrogenase n=1 Tax=Actinotalea sp. C106 TaxID=2908644 RepID=UPI0020286B27